MAKSRYNIKGTKDFLVASVVCAFFCLWAIRDAWFPTTKILKKHPQRFEVSALVPGVIQSIPVKVGEEIQGEMVLAKLNETSHQSAIDEAEKAFKEAKTKQSDDIQEKLDVLIKAREKLKACTIYNTDFTLKTSHGEDALQGKVLEVIATPATHVDEGEVILVVQPKDTFYAFNKTLSVLSLIGAIGFLIFHRIASR